MHVLYYLFIIKDYYSVSGSDASRIGWVEVTTEDGKSGYLWYLKAESETRLRFEDYLEMAMVEGELNVKGLLKLMSSGSVSGKITYGSLQINEGGKLIGEIDYKDKNILQEEFKDFKAL